MPIQATGRRVAITVAELLVLTLIVTLGLMLFYQIGVASADPVAAVPDLDKDPGGFLEQAFQATRSGDWTMVTALALIGCVWVARKPWALGKVAFFKTDRGGVAMVLGLSIVGGLANAIIALGKFPTDMLTYKAILQTAVTAIGGYVALKRIIWPSDKKPADPAPATPG